MEEVSPFQMFELENDSVVGLQKRLIARSHKYHEVSEVRALAFNLGLREVREVTPLTTQTQGALIKEETLDVFVGDDILESLGFPVIDVFNH